MHNREKDILLLGKQIKAARNFYVHQYGNIDWTSVWEVKYRYLPILKNHLNKIID
ncbi:MAG: DUF86 domain-containing protein [Sphingobacteriales bacterium]|nr:DUF86 domain-containing protein [Sphingobacteriales bacterium]